MVVVFRRTSPGCVLGLLRFFPSSRARRVQALAHFLQLHARLQGLGSISFFFLFSGPGRDVGLAQLRTQSQNLLPCLGLQFFARQHFGGRRGGGGGGAGGGGGSAGGGGAWCCRCCWLHHAVVMGMALVGCFLLLHSGTTWWWGGGGILLGFACRGGARDSHHPSRVGRRGSGVDWAAQIGSSSSHGSGSSRWLHACYRGHLGAHVSGGYDDGASSSSSSSSSSRVHCKRWWWIRCRAGIIC